MHCPPTAFAPGIRIVAALTLAVFASGCGDPLQRDKPLVQVDPRQLQDIQPVDLASESRTPPVTVEQAANESIAKLVEPKPPPATMEFSIAEVRADALANNLDLKVAVYDPTIAGETLDVERAKFESVFFASANRAVRDTPVALETEGSSVKFDQFDAGVRIPLQTGGTVTVDVPFSTTDTNNPFSTLNPSYDASLQFSISQPLLRGAWDDATLYSIRVARYQSYQADARTRLEAIRILANADRAYWRLYAAQRELIVRQQQYELAMNQLAQARRKVTAGESAEIEITRAQSGVASRLERIIIAESTVKRFRRDLKRIVNRADLPLDGPTAIIITTEPTPLDLDLDPQALATVAVANRMEMLELELQLAIDSSTIKFEKNAALPLVVLDYTYGINGLGSSFGQAFRQVGDFSFEDHVFGVRGEIPIGNEAAKSRVNRAILQRLQRLATKEQRATAIRQEVFDALDQLDQNWQRILAARQESILAGRTLEGEQRQFDVGLRTSTDVLDAAARLADAQSNEILALADYQIAQIDIAFATGTLLGSTHVVWEPATAARK